MAPEQITQALQAIGPHVRYNASEVDGRTLHTWLISERQPSNRGKVANLAMLGDIEPLSEDDIAEGKRRYEASANGLRS